MTDWKPGDRFRLEATGTVAKADFGLDLELPIAVDFDEDRTSNGAYGFDSNWFNAHATKIKRPFQFGDRVQLGTDLNDWRVLQDSGDEVILWLVGQPTTHVVEDSERHLLSLAEED